MPNTHLQIVLNGHIHKIEYLDFVYFIKVKFVLSFLTIWEGKARILLVFVSGQRSCLQIALSWGVQLTPTKCGWNCAFQPKHAGKLSNTAYNIKYLYIQKCLRKLYCVVCSIIFIALLYICMYFFLDGPHLLQ